MKNIYRIVALLAIVIFCVASIGAYQPQKTKDTAHEIAELARSLGLPEDDPIIVRARELWWEADEEFCRDRDITATLLFNEAGYGCSDRHMELVAVVPWNRVKSDKFPDNIYDVVCQKRQYHPAYADPNSYYSLRARADEETWKKCQEIAARAMLGGVECPEDVLFQAEFVQGKGIYETHTTTYSTTHFCYG